MTFAEQLKQEKARLGLSLATMAKTLEIGQRTLEHWIKGDRIPLPVTQEGTLARLQKKKTPPPTLKRY